MTGKTEKPVVTREDIARALAALGLERGDCVIAHSSLSTAGSSPASISASR